VGNPGNRANPRGKSLRCEVQASSSPIAAALRVVCGSICGVALLILTNSVSAQPAPDSFPLRPVRIVVPFGPGSGTDTATRILARQLEVALKQSVIVDNRPGASGSIAASAVARGAPDGYTLLMGSNSTHGANSGLFAKLPYDPLRDFVPVGLVGVFSSFLVVDPALPVRTPVELVAYGKANPKALTFAAGNTSSLIMGEMFGRGTGIEMLRVPYSSNPAGLTDVMAGRVSVMFADISSSLAHVKSGAVRVLAAVTLGERSPLAFDVPTVAETVVPNFHFVGWIGLFAPAGTPGPVITKLSMDLKKVVAMPEVAQRLQQIGADAQWMGPDEFRVFIASEVARLPKILADIGVRPQ
jgi:tripartite-type tricarboxylate transporter receptor subunit TctC